MNWQVLFAMSVWTFENPSAGVRAPRTEAAQPPHVMFGTSRVYSLPPLSPVVFAVVEGGVGLGAGDAPLQPTRTISPMRPTYLGMERSLREKKWNHGDAPRTNRITHDTASCPPGYVQQLTCCRDRLPESPRPLRADPAVPAERLGGLAIHDPLRLQVKLHQL